MSIQSDGASAAPLELLHRALYLRREYAIVATCGEFDDVLLTPPQSEMSADAMWHGLLHIRRPASPWCGGVFAFAVRVPPRYPFECPFVRMESPLQSHPLLREDGEGRRCVVPFENVYFGLDPMRVSVMAQMLHCVRSIFYPSEWPADEPVDTSLARHEVEQGSVTQEVILGGPYVDFLSQEAVAFFTDLKGIPASDVLESDKEWESKFSLWFGHKCLPAVRTLQ